MVASFFHPLFSICIFSFSRSRAVRAGRAGYTEASTCTAAWKLGRTLTEHAGTEHIIVNQSIETTNNRTCIQKTIYINYKVIHDVHWWLSGSMVGWLGLTEKVKTQYKHTWLVFTFFDQKEKSCQNAIGIRMKSLSERFDTDGLYGYADSDA